MGKRLDQATGMRTEVHVLEFKEGELLKVRLLERGSSFCTGKERVHIR
jgi:hypothetical protein